MNEILKIYTYNENGEKIKENNYSEFIKVLFDTVNYNIQNEECKLNIICATQYPPLGLKWNSEIKEWEENIKHKIIIDKQLNNFIKSF
jgi:hypothetical protein